MVVMSSKREIKKIILHCSASDKPSQDNIAAIKQLHTDPTEVVHLWGNYKTKGKGWSDVGYHFFIRRNGVIERGRPIEIAGAHCKGQNSDSIGICLSGEYEFTRVQLSVLKEFLFHLCREYKLGNDQIFGHRHFDKSKTCPNFDVNYVLPL